MSSSRPSHQNRNKLQGRRTVGKRLPQARRRLRIEPLEDRCLLSITVNTLVDEADGSIDDGDISLRDAIALAPAGETIDFNPALTSGGPATIQLLNIGDVELRILNGLTIQGPGADLLTINAYDPTPAEKNGDGARVLRLGGSAPISIDGLTISGGDTLDAGGVSAFGHVTLANCIIRGNSAIRSGGGIEFLQDTLLVITGCTIRDNAAGSGGGISNLRPGPDGFTSSIWITSSTITDNRATGAGSPGGPFGAGSGGGIALQDADVSIAGSIVENNSAAVSGGGIAVYSSGLTSTLIENSLVTGNTSKDGGGIHHYSGNLTVTDSTISGNAAESGGGIYSQNSFFGSSQATITNSTISGNMATVDGGGAFFANYAADMTVIIRHSTITNNEAPTDMGGGVASTAEDTGIHVEIGSSIVADNPSGSDIQFVNGLSNPFVSLGYNVVGLGNGTAAFGAAMSGDLVGVSAMLDVLADNGGQTMTHAPLPGSPAIDAGDPAAVAGVGDVPLYDQRGNPFTRVHGGRIDIGAFEFQLVAPVLPGDYDLDGEVDDADYLVWRQQFGSMVAEFSGADGNGNGGVDAADCTVWRDNLGRVTQSSGSQSPAAIEPATAVAAAVDESGATAALGLGSDTIVPALVMRRRGPRREFEHRFIESYDPATQLLLLQRYTQRHGENGAATLESDSDAVLKAREELFGRLGEGVDSVRERPPSL